MKPGSRFAELDALRGIAAAAVMLYHFLIAFPKFYGESLGLGWQPFAEAPVTRDLIGTAPVCLFFMISGFVILNSLRGREDAGTPIADFAFSRFARLFPVFWAAAALTFVVGLIAPLPDQHHTMGQLIGNLTMVPRYAGVTPLDHVYWSLLFELQFYGWMALIAVTGLLGRLRLVCALWLAVEVLFLLNQAAGLELPTALYWAMNAPFTHYFLAGICFYRLATGHGDRQTLYLLGAALAVNFLAFAPWFAVLTGTFWLVFHLAVAGRLHFVAVRPLLWLGTVSYALYLVHMMIGFRIMYSLQLAGVGYGLSVIAAIAVSLVLAAGMTFLIERPAQRLLKGWYRSARQILGDKPVPGVS
ncbi:acyltransferase family protein [Aquisalinus flavus]|uniref:Acyltransferase n=1 Tax=Aquisalinus flavus TaxID=1526572 RepID=A0A8J2Y5R5_9PROT|nr:acyltransferase [Aquisalinus flavus]MBD0425443.1 acyltransferase [Aquisalinus flavus]UNE48918.1 acyltransferase [Aquisalinus flavus]GGD16000.1 acyltransferase [Aquisalinus flavus]